MHSDPAEGRSAPGAGAKGTTQALNNAPALLQPGDKSDEQCIDMKLEKQA